jgi:hypothetical protein
MTTYYVVVDMGRVCMVSFSQLQRGHGRRHRGYKIEASDAETAKQKAIAMYNSGEPSSPDAFRKF